jgi:DNA-binding CsgD family transcriptional regulator
MARLKITPDFEVAMRRFGDDPLTGVDLEIIRSSVLGYSQEQLGAEWGISRNQISRIEKKVEPDAKTSDAYRGLLLRHFMTKKQA